MSITYQILKSDEDNTGFDNQVTDIAFLDACSLADVFDQVPNTEVIIKKDMKGYSVLTKKINTGGE